MRIRQLSLPKTGSELHCKSTEPGPGAAALVARDLALHTPDPKWAPVCAPVAPLPLYLPACDLGKEWRKAQNLGTLNPPGRPERDSQLSASDQFGFSHGRHRRNEPKDGRFLSLFSLCKSASAIKISNSLKTTALT